VGERQWKIEKWKRFSGCPAQAAADLPSGYDPKTFKNRALRSSDLSARESLGSSRCPITSTKNRYSHGRARSGRDSIFDILIALRANRFSAWFNVPTRSATANSSVVLSARADPDRSTGRVPITRNRVVLVATSCTFDAIGLSPYASPAAADAIAAIDESSAARRAASALDATASVSQLGKFALR